MKRLIIATLIGGGVFATVLGSAAALIVNGGGVQGGQTASAVCDTDGVNVTYQDLNSDGTFDQATVSGIDCSGTLNVHVEGQNSTNGVLAYGTNPAGGSGTTLVALTDGLSPSEVAPLDHTVVNIVQVGP